MMQIFLVLVMMMTLSDATADAAPPSSAHGLIDDFSAADGRSRLGPRWRLATDRVMGGVSDAAMTVREVEDRRALCLSGNVSLENNGGFVQVNIDLTDAGTGELDARGFTGVRLLVRGNGETYHVHLKTSATTLPWQSYRAAFATGPAWREVRLPFSTFTPHRLVPVLDPGRLRRLGIVAIGQAMQAEVCVAEVGFY